MDLLVRSITVESNYLEANPLRSIIMTAEVVWIKPITHTYWKNGQQAHSTYHEMGLYGKITTSEPNQIIDLHRWFHSQVLITEDQLFGRTALLEAGVGA